MGLTRFRDILVQPRRNRHAAVRFFRTLLKTQQQVPRRLITDKLRSYSAACRTVMPSVLHCTDQYANNRAEVSHQPTRQRERQIRRFKSAAQLQRFASVHGIVQNLFRVGRHLLRADNARQLAGGGGPMSRPSDIHPAIAQTTERDLSLFVRKQFVPFRLHDERLDRQIETVPSPQLRETVRHLGQ